MLCKNCERVIKTGARNLNDFLVKEQEKCCCTKKKKKQEKQKIK